jgi:LPS-assembly lipoprotein
MMAKCQAIVLVVIVLGLSACGFQLRSEADLAGLLGSTRLTVVDEFSPFARQLQSSMRRSGIDLVAEQGEPESIINVTANQVSREILSIGDTARVREYRIGHRVEFVVLNAEGEILLAPQVLEQSRDLSFDEGELLAATREEEFVRAELAKNLVRLVMQRLGMLDSR